MIFFACGLPLAGIVGYLLGRAIALRQVRRALESVSSSPVVIVGIGDRPFVQRGPDMPQ
jgi:hypothetical protein